MSFIKNLFGSGAQGQQSAPLVEARATLALADRWDPATTPAITIYPPVDPGLPAVGVEDILHGAQRKLKRLAEIAGGTESDFEKLYLGPIRALAAQIHLLPASPHSHYSAPAGLFNMCLDIAIMSRQAAEGKMFVPEASIEIRQRTGPAWRYAAFLAGLMCQLHVPVGSLTVTDGNGQEWPRFGMSIATWLQSAKLTRYFVIWHEKARVTGAEGASLLGSVVPAEVMDWLAQTDGQIVRDLNIAVTREMSASESILGSIVRSVTARIKEVDALQQPARFGRLTIGTQFEVHLLNAMRELIETGKWTVNTPDGKVFWGSDGLYVSWPEGLSEVLEVFERRKLDAMPRSSVTLAEMLGLSGVIISRDAGVWVHDIVAPAGGSNSGRRVHSAMRFKDPGVLLGHLGCIVATTPFGKLLVDAQEEQIAQLAKGRLDSATPAMPTIAESVPEGSEATAELRGGPNRGTVPTGSDSTSRTVQESPPGQPEVLNPAAVQEVAAEEGPPGRRVPPELLARLKLKETDDGASALGMAIVQSKAYRGDRVRTLDWGVAICIRWLRDVAGYDVADLVAPLERMGVLAKDPSAKTVASISNVVFSDSPKARLAIILKLDFAAKLGMPTDAKV